MEFKRFRFIILALGTLCATSILANMNIYNFTKICAEPISQDTEYGNYTTMKDFFTSLQQSTLQSAPAIGALAAGVPYLYIFSKFPSRYAFFSAGLISIISTSLIPLMYSLGFATFLAFRILQGVAFSTMFYVIGCIISEWATLAEHGIFLAFLTGATQLSNIFTLPVSGFLCSTSLGWPSVYYVHAALCLVLFILWIVIYRDDPKEHWLVSSTERMQIEEGKTKRDIEIVREPIPYLKIFTDIPILGVWFAAIAELLYVQLVSQYEPVYFNKYLDFDLLNSGFMSALPIIVQFIAKLIAGFASDSLSCISPTANVRLFNTFALGVSGIMMVALAFVPRSQQTLCVVTLTAAVSFTGFCTAGFNKAATLRSRQHAHFVMTVIMNIWSFTILVEPFIVDPILTDPTNGHQWAIVFLIHGAFAFVANIVFLVVSDARPAKWTYSVLETVSTKL